MKQSGVSIKQRQVARGKPNVLFIAIDDLHPELGCYGSKIAITPHLAWRDHRRPKSQPLFLELFDHQADPGETTNIAPANPNLARQLLTKLDAGWRSALPEN